MHLIEVLECDELTFPLSIVKNDNSVMIIDSLTQLVAYASGEEVDDFVYPIEIVDNDGNSKTVNNANQLKGQTNDCDKKEKKDTIEDLQKCYQIVFPINVITSDSVNVQVNSVAELIALFAADRKSELVYPFDVIDQNGDTITVDGQAKIEELIDLCD